MNTNHPRRRGSSEPERPARRLAYSTDADARRRSIEGSVMVTRRKPAAARQGVPAGAITEPLERTLDHESFTPRLMALLTHALVWRESYELRKQFGMGTNEWRVLSSLAVHPGLTSGDVAAFLDLNKAMVSRSTNVLLAEGLIVLGEGPRGSRPIYLTEAGARMHDRMLPISVQGQSIILEDIPPEDVEQLNSVLREMLKKTRELHRVEVAAERES
ncbi:MarR family winged helix-turn-helix transcriptional regulator [Leucobacter allii]|uniref:MarR family winged helix-turn-helix transcriptional regulator n=1 Tax=Leucobacter allii TaxID=2932247 RepID=A0ABY4FM82_9MICO|nr:MarR family winged helix-turn-helix transcriptional regulator [Leucobacter allii]UOQ57387.1 MarR family winged helix-turn-helix transcriptional regulator [Leucobacter allii]UOR01835.1 MarR family winged helix-turn-helix transcriptional regulator [Leucobacter allii]